MATIGFDTATAATSVCLMSADGTVYESPEPEPGWQERPPGHVAELLPEIHRLLQLAGIGFEDVQEVAVGVGPGTFTGLRIGIATARAMGQALDIPLRPVSTLAAIAVGLGEVAAPGKALVPIIDAKRGEVFFSVYTAGDPECSSEASPGPAKKASGSAMKALRSVPETSLSVTGAPALNRVWEESVAPPGELAERLRASAAAAAEGALAAGDGAIKFRAELEAVGLKVLPVCSAAHAPRALHLCRLAGGIDPVEPDDIQPTYLRLPDAEISRRKGPTS